MSILCFTCKVLCDLDTIEINCKSHDWISKSKFTKQGNTYLDHKLNYLKKLINNHKLLKELCVKFNYESELILIKIDAPTLNLDDFYNTILNEKENLNNLNKKNIQNLFSKWILVNNELSLVLINNYTDIDIDYLEETLNQINKEIKIIKNKFIEEFSNLIIYYNNILTELKGDIN